MKSERLISKYCCILNIRRDIKRILNRNNSRFNGKIIFDNGVNKSKSTLTLNISDPSFNSKVIFKSTLCEGHDTIIPGIENSSLNSIVIYKCRVRDIWDCPLKITD